MTPHPQGEAGTPLPPCDRCGGNLSVSKTLTLDWNWKCGCGMERGYFLSESEARRDAISRALRAPLEGPTGLPPEVKAAAGRITNSGRVYSGILHDALVLEKYVRRSLPPAPVVSEKVDDFVAELSARRCENFTIGDCYSNGRRSNAVYGSGLACCPCRAREALRLLPEDKRGGGDAVQ